MPASRCSDDFFSRRRRGADPLRIFRDRRESGRARFERAQGQSGHGRLEVRCAHSATLNRCFYTGDQFPAEYRGDLFAAFHGSWNRTRRTGYKIVRVPLDHATGKAGGEYEDFVTGFVTQDGNVWGRPVGITVAKDGSLLFSEDGNGTIWRVSYGK